jgi:hypothetical protein
MPPTDPDQNAPRKTDHPADDSGWQIRAEMALATTAANNRLITYAELAEAAGLTGRHRINRLTVWLEELIDSDAAANVPLRAARVISRARGGLPAPGFFMKCAALDLYDGPTDGPQAYSFHLNCLR